MQTNWFRAPTSISSSPRTYIAVVARYNERVAEWSTFTDQFFGILFRFTGYAFLIILFAILFFLYLGGAEPDTYNAYFIIEWIIYTILSLYLGFRPRRFRTGWAAIVSVLVYLVVAIVNLLLLSAGGKCFDLYGNIYPFAGLNPHEWQACIPQL